MDPTLATPTPATQPTEGDVPVMTMAQLLQAMNGEAATTEPADTKDAGTGKDGDDVKEAPQHAEPDTEENELLLQAAREMEAALYQDWQN